MLISTHTLGGIRRERANVKIQDTKPMKTFLKIEEYIHTHAHTKQDIPQLIDDLLFYANEYI